MGCRGVFECEGASLMIHPEICRQRLALVKMPWGLLLWVVWNQFKSRFLGKLFALLPFCPGAQEGLLAQTQLYISTTLTGFNRVWAGRWGGRRHPGSSGPELQHWLWKRRHRRENRCKGLPMALCQPSAPTTCTSNPPPIRW